MLQIKANILIGKMTMKKQLMANYYWLFHC